MFGEVPQAILHNILKVDSTPNVGIANGKALSIVETIEVMVQIGTSMEFVIFILAYRLTISVILACHFFDRYVEAINPRLSIVGMEDGPTVAIGRQPSKDNEDLLLPEDGKRDGLTIYSTARAVNASVSYIPP